MNILITLPNDAPIYPLAPKYLQKLIIYLPKSTSKNLPLALSLMRQAEAFAEIPIDNGIFYGAVFSIEPKPLTIVKSIIDFALNWKGFNIFYNGELVNDKGGFYATLHCLINATKCSDYRSYCHRVESFNNNFETSISLFSILKPKSSDDYLIPCRRISYSLYQINSKHPSSVINQLEARAIEQGCDWCPYFNLADFRKV